MKVIIDTCSWLKLDELVGMKMFSVESLYNWVDVNITHEVLKEVKHFRVKTYLPERTTILPIGNAQLYEAALKFDLDTADASILSYGSTTYDLIIVSEDPGLLDFARMRKMVALEFIDFFQFLTKEDYLSKRELYQKARFLRAIKNVTKKRFKEIKIFLQSL